MARRIALTPPDPVGVAHRRGQWLQALSVLTRILLVTQPRTLRMKWRPRSPWDWNSLRVERAGRQFCDRLHAIS